MDNQELDILNKKPPRTKKPSMDDLVPTSLMDLTAECKVLRELQLRTEDVVKTLSSRNDRIVKDVAILQEHFKAYRETIRDILTSATDLRLQVSQLESDLKYLKEDVCTIEDRKTGCNSRFDEFLRNVAELKTQLSHIEDELKSITLRMEDVDGEEGEIAQIKQVTGKIVVFENFLKIGKFIAMTIAAIFTFLAALGSTLVAMKSLGWSLGFLGF